MATNTAKEPPSILRPGAPGWPGVPARWTSSAKSGVGTAIGAGSRVVFTLFWHDTARWDAVTYRVSCVERP